MKITGSAGRCCCGDKDGGDDEDPGGRRIFICPVYGFIFTKTLIEVDEEANTMTWEIRVTCSPPTPTEFTTFQVTLSLDPPDCQETDLTGVVLVPCGSPGIVSVGNEPGACRCGTGCTIPPDINQVESFFGSLAGFSGSKVYPNPGFYLTAYRQSAETDIVLPIMEAGDSIPFNVSLSVDFGNHGATDPEFTAHLSNAQALVHVIGQPAGSYGWSMRSGVALNLEEHPGTGGWLDLGFPPSNPQPDGKVYSARPGLSAGGVETVDIGGGVASHTHTDHESCDLSGNIVAVDNGGDTPDIRFDCVSQSAWAGVKLTQPGAILSDEAYGDQHIITPSDNGNFTSCLFLKLRVDWTAVVTNSSTFDTDLMIGTYVGSIGG